VTLDLPAAWDPAWDGVRLDREYSPSSCVPSLHAYLDGYAETSAAVRREHEVRRGVRYGPHPAETLDLYPAPPGPDGAPPPLHVFVHGGNWQLLSAADSAFPAPGFLRRGVAFAAVDYALAPPATLDEIVAMVRRCLAWLPGQAAGLGFDPARIQVSGTSAGAHLVAMALVAGVPAGVAGAVLLSGMYDLEPVRRSYVNDALGLDAAAAERNSPLFRLPASLPPVVLARGGNETEGYARQHAAMLAALRARSAAVVDVVDPARNHFDLPGDLAAAGTPLGAAVLAQLGLAGPGDAP
jgi:arylformamidase